MQNKKLSNLAIYTDGGARGNPGPAAIGIVIKEESQVVYEKGEYIGKATNNVAEYRAIAEALSWIAKEKSRIKGTINCFLDSTLVVNQLNGLFKIKNADLRQLLFQIKKLEVEIDNPIAYHHIPREQNQDADALVNKALDKELHV